MKRGYRKALRIIFIIGIVVLFLGTVTGLWNSEPSNTKVSNTKHFSLVDGKMVQVRVLIPNVTASKRVAEIEKTKKEADSFYYY